MKDEFSHLDPGDLYYKHQLPGANFEEDSLVATEAHQVVEDNTMQIHVAHARLSDAGYYKCYYQDELVSDTDFRSHVQIGGMGM